MPHELVCKCLERRLTCSGGNPMHTGGVMMLEKH